jgi:hypothetical protein
MGPQEIRDASLAALGEAGARMEISVTGAQTFRMTECQFYKAIRTLAHEMDRDASADMTRPKKYMTRYGFKAMAGAMTQMIERRCRP